MVKYGLQLCYKRLSNYKSQIMLFWRDLYAPFGRSTMLEVDMFVPGIGTNASFWRVQVVRSLDCKSCIKTRKKIQGAALNNRVTWNGMKKGAIKGFVFAIPVVRRVDLWHIMFRENPKESNGETFKNPPPCACMMLPVVSVQAAPGTMTAPSETRAATRARKKQIKDIVPERSKHFVLKR